MKKILITGAGGFVGSRILQQWQGKYELCALPKGFFCTADEALTRAQVEALHPDVILHTAALSDTSYCAQHPAEAYRANVELPVWLARAAQQTKAKLVAFSSDQVYAGVQQQGPLPETLALHPANIYGQYKLKAEQRVLELCPDSVHLRASWMYDLPGYGLPIRGNLPLNLLRAALKGEALRFSRNDHRGVTYVRQVIENLEPAMALAAGEDGLVFYRAIAEHYQKALRPGGALALEIGWQQREAVTALLAANGWTDIVCRKDFGGNDRCVMARKQ